MNILGIDYGLKKVGLALAADSPLAEPMATLARKSDQQLISALAEIVDVHQVGLVVLGLPAGVMAKKVRDFAGTLESAIKVPIKFVDEEYTSKQAQIHARQAGKSGSKIKRKEHEWAATIILQSYIDSEYV